jgi:UDP-N-acetyl-D-mannosaminuronate dehydrogenase
MCVDETLNIRDVAVNIAVAGMGYVGLANAVRAVQFPELGSRSGIPAGENV